MTNVIPIWYAGDESGPAQVLRGRLARIMSTPLLADDLWRGDIVLLTHRPGDGEGWPRIARVVHQRYDAVTTILFHELGQAWVLSAVFAILGAETSVLTEPRGESPGRLAVAYDGPLDPIQLAEAVGVGQNPLNEGEVETYYPPHGGEPSAEHGDPEDGGPDPEQSPPSGPRKPR